MKSKSANSFFEFIASLPKIWKIGMVLLLSVILILLLTEFGKEDAADGTAGSLEEEVEALCSSVGGVGECEVMITYKDTESDEVYAVAILCEGADSVEVRADLVELIGSIFGIGANRIAILKIEK